MFIESDIEETLTELLYLLEVPSMCLLKEIYQIKENLITIVDLKSVEPYSFSNKFGNKNEQELRIDTSKRYCQEVGLPSDTVCTKYPQVNYILNIFIL